MAEISENALTTISERYHAYLSWSPAKQAGEKVLFTYRGEISQHRIETLLKLAESSILDNGYKRKVMKRVGSILIETLQNISLHGVKERLGSGLSFITLLVNQTHFTLVTGNIILLEEANLLSYKLDELNKLNAPELRKLYIETLCNQNFSYKGGAGLGLLTVAKKSGHPINYRIEAIDDTYAYFISEVLVDSQAN